MAQSAFWQFSLRFYAEPDVAQACLGLQEAHGIDVNVMLYLLFLARAGRRLDSAAIARIEAIADEWRSSIVVPLRGVRTRLKTPVGAFEPAITAPLRAQVKRIELEAERLQQETMERLAPAPELGEPDADADACARHNLARYTERFGSLAPHALTLVLQRFAQARHTA